ncbi:hypothetical protein JQ634_32485 [Bradyrhizobium sp. AUGA SZCCT0240]|uniref:hypothetical protein n=1 Tax=unclassified Bradyrhizobium TaxID=2631580 RepID=UPI001BA61BAA|nr:MULTISPECIES: hypothetical protein [unclassified Bradyrhizobium]MBR1195716.1 hypothetical protein [Bradyrhizobium sp. AUGA SZCCT0158]MBR1243481.1 hypothetical protein [Bradyrhizobium sp. AUGA SZCCT0274]MBR1258376.1 hypothetical protein [Bradyrhizobium sp. AUGA SZCCT0240]
MAIAFVKARLVLNVAPGLAGKVGTVINRRPDSSIVIVRFDGNRNLTSLHREYIEPTEAKAQ